MNSEKTWSSDGFQGVMLHEIGHALGFNHVNKLAVMNDGFNSTMAPEDNFRAVGQHNKITPLADDRSGIRFIYPNGEIERNLTANRFRALDDGRIPKNTNSTNFHPAGASGYYVRYTIQNAGSITENGVQVYLYLSTNETLSSSGYLLGSAT